MATKRGPVEQATWRDLTPELRRSGLAQAALALARLLDGEFRGTCRVCQQEAEFDVDASARDSAALAREHRATLLELAKRTPPKAKEDGVDDLQRRRQARRAAAGRPAP